MKPTSKEVINELSKILDATPKKINGFMTPKEKAKQLVKMFQFETDINEIIAKFNTHKAKGCALIAVDMVIKCCKDYDEVHENYTTQVDHWMEVKKEIEKL
jgi:hypothetical protein